MIVITVGATKIKIWDVILRDVRVSNDNKRIDYSRTIQFAEKSCTMRDTIEINEPFTIESFELRKKEDRDRYERCGYGILG